MVDIALYYNPDGAARATLVDGGTGELIPDFPYEVVMFRSDDKFVIQRRTLDGKTGEEVATAPLEDPVGARDQVVAALKLAAEEAGHTVEGMRLGDAQEMNS